MERTRVNISRSGAGGSHGQKGQDRPKWGSQSLGHGETERGPESSGPGEVQLWNTFTGSQFCPVEDHGQQGQVRPRWGPETPNPGEAQVETTVTRSRVVSGADQNPQVHVRCRWQRHSPGPGEAPVGTRAVSYTHLTLPTTRLRCRSRWSPYH